MGVVESDMAVKSSDWGWKQEGNKPARWMVSACIYAPFIDAGLILSFMLPEEYEEGRNEHRETQMFKPALNWKNLSWNQLSYAKTDEVFCVSTKQGHTLKWASVVK